ncbi:hypothetical protein KFZ58_13490 [Virgibacillus sp. NKC19-16]|uniref:hypothetical protein n=1 Tax=Virgibacillus salidurans TaxID=2831673 RepID=UPI001F27C27D|nr:hypothetical protein [Virgibacillus sp. NKC19-16]UJL45412.1 hypothetical protein KFZ58_13490 [Virgibacillus sp. NKC19-16]
MIQSVFTIGGILTAVVLVISIFLANASKKESHVRYYPSVYVAVVGLLLVLIAPIIGKVEIMGAGFGGWGIAALFAAAIGFVITSIMDAYAQDSKA